MSGITDLTVRLIRAGRLIYERKWSFLGLFAVVFLVSVSVLGEIGLLPNVSSAAKIPPATSINQSGIVAATELPVKIEIAKINLSTVISNPATTDVTLLDKELLKGAVRYPTSAKLGETGNVVLFAHSSYIPVVGNQAYKAFNGIQKLVVGDVVTVYSATMVYTYRVRSFTKESANDNISIPLSVNGKILTLVTCNSFGTKEDRFVVVADFVESHSIPL
ncbi:MAG TPA: sortase [Candidatus Paceibacterota bacterium]